MKTYSSTRSNLLRTLILLPLAALMIYGFSTREIVQQEESSLVSLVNQEKATPEQIAEYNKLAKKYNAQDDNNRFIKKSEVERLKYLYNLMSAKQRKNAEPFPNFPPPPKAPKPIKAPKSVKVVKGVNDTGTNIPPSPPKSPKAPKAQKAPKPIKVVKGVNDTGANIPPPPPPPVADKNSWEHKNEEDSVPPPPPIVRLEPLDHIVRMAKKNAAFFYEGKRISSDMAIALIKKNESLNIETETFKASNPVVKITTKGVRIEN